MADHSSILKTKLYRPPISDDSVLRTEILESLNSHVELPLTLVSAPAGYGKSYTISQWIENLQAKHAWISLDSDHNNLRTFLEYFVAGIRLAYPEALGSLSSYLAGVKLPPIQEMAYDLINELDGIEDQFIIVLDDYHKIKNEQIHELLNTLVQFPPQNTHLVLITRIDPPLKLNHLRAYGRIHELRVNSLSFDEKETTSLYKKLIQGDLRAETLQHLHEKTEGWIVGLRLALFYANQADDVNKAILEVKGDIRLIANFLLDEVLSKQSLIAIQYLLSTAILDRFNAEIIGAMSEHNEDEYASQEFINNLLQANLFLIALDHDNNWFRYHHLFQELLITQLTRRFSREEINTMHLKAAQWFNEQALFDEAINHFLEAGDVQSAAIIVEQQAHRIFGKGGLVRVGSWLSKIPSDICDQRPALLLMQAWNAFGSFHLEMIPPLIEKSGALLREKKAEPLIHAEQDFFIGNLSYWMGDTVTSIQTLKKALDYTKELPIHVLGNIELVLNMARQRQGEIEVLIPEIQKQLKNIDPDRGYYIAYTYASLTFVLLLSGRMKEAWKVAHDMQIHTAKIKAQYQLNWSYYMQASADFQMCQLENSVIHFNNVIKWRFNIDSRAALDALSGMAVAQQLNQKPEEALKTIKELQGYATELGDPQSQLIAQSAAARVDLHQGNLSKALQWENTFVEPVNFPGVFFWIEVPWITKAKILIVQGSAANLSKAQKLLMELTELLEASNLQFHQVEISMLLAIVYDKSGKKAEAASLILKTLVDAKRLSCIRPFIEMGDYVKDLLGRLIEQQVEVDFIDHLLTRMKSKKPIVTHPGGQKSSINVPNSPVIDQQERLSAREFEVLEFVAEGFRNKEIANKLFVSEVTIKKHLYNIFKKLNVNNRINMVQKAKELWIIGNA
jgi:LuxR family maltose regulon positive regulatory protein